MDHAIILTCGTGVNNEPLNSFGNTLVAKVSLLKRLVINCERAGIKNFYLVSDDETKKSLKNIVKDKRIKSSIQWVKQYSSFDSNADKFLILQTNLLIHSLSVEDFIKKSKNIESITTLSKFEKNFDSSRDNSNWKEGMFTSSKDQADDLIQSPNVSEWIEKKSINSEIIYLTPENGYWATANQTKDSLEDLENLIFANVGKTATGWIARNINGRISLPISKQLIKTPLTPNMVSVLINVIGMLCGPFYALGYPVLGALFMQIATVLDRCDGEVARIKLMETKKGQWVDTLSDQVTVLSFIIGVSLGYYLESGKSIALILGGINLSIFIFFLIWSFYFLIKFTNSGSLVAYYEVDKVIDKEDTTIMRRIIAFLRPLGRRNFYSLGFLVVAMIGGYPWVLGILTFSLILFLLHQVEDVIKIRKLKRETSN